MVKLKVAVAVETDDDLEFYSGAKTPADAAKILKKWIDDGAMALGDLLMGDAPLAITVEPVS